MGSLAVLTMAHDISRSEHTTRKPLHPFFASNRSAAPISDKKEVDEDSELKTQPLLSSSGDGERIENASENPAPQSKRRKVASQVDEQEQKKPRAKKRPKSSIEGGIANHFMKLNTPSIPSPDAASGTEVSLAKTELDPSSFATDSQKEGLGEDGKQRSHSPVALADSTDNSRPRPHTPPAAVAGDPVRAKKVLQLNPKTGTIGSPPSRKQKPVRKLGAIGMESTQGTASPSKIVIVKYGNNNLDRARIGRKVNAILSGDERFAAQGAPISPSKRKSPDSAPVTETTTPKRPKTTHPFFLGKSKKSETVPAKEVSAKGVSPVQKRVKQFSSTPCSPKKPRTDTLNVRLPQFGVKNSGMKFPGAKSSAWPWKGMVHLRDSDFPTELEQDLSLPFPLRKSKGHAVKIPAHESVVETVALQLDIPRTAKEVRNVDTDVFLPPPLGLRLPGKHFESGLKLQSRILPELRTFSPPPITKQRGQGKQLAMNKGGLQPPPQLARLFESISSGLSAFDRSQCESANWAQKYAPISAVEVLQEGREQFLLRDWLQALMVQSVDTGAQDAEKTKGGSVRGKSVGTGKKRRKKLDGFIVSSGDEDDGLYALSDDDENWAPSGSRGIIRKTVVRSSNLAKSRDGGKISNTLVISGPQGCGKTSAVYAVAKELDFEVFELNPGSRRSGKDILEKIGDMTRNHHVQQHQSSIEDKEEPATEDDVARDVKSGKQSTMSAFFKPKPVTIKGKKPATPSNPLQQKEPKKEPAKNQRQSLILIEEADIIYEEDKQFWATITSLMVQSRRPFVITCNDETILPLQILKLHGIFRLTPPPREYAVDRLILVAANEGHALTRRTVEALYESRGQDLRAATTDLQLWCQMGVGDRRGGFEWFYPRWPKGVDVDENGHVVRVVSQGTYTTGMSWLGRDSILDSQVPPRFIEEELLSQCWSNWELDVGHWEDSTDLSRWADRLDATITNAGGRLKVLEAFSDFADAMSLADRSACKSFATATHELIDATLPEPSAKARDDCVQGFIHITTPPMTYYDSSPLPIATTIKSLAKASLRANIQPLENEPSPELQPLGEDKAVHCIQNSFTGPAPGADLISRIDFAFAFDPIAVSDTAQAGLVSYLDPSVFDRTLKMIALEVAPYVRGIVSYDSELQKQRQKLSSLVSEGGRPGRGSKRMRMTKASISALEGGSRSTTRSQKWFTADLNPYLVMKTAGKGWARPFDEGTETPSTPKTSPTSPSPVSSPASPKPVPKKGARRGRPRKEVVREDSADELGDDHDTSCM